ncbi:hypothetical protein AB0O64_05755 [Streptomyces sp. NPDC088341]|uniref:hypothetical protein n=1 Tax=Streptomyces sp. NPDC088341 TaxID=3154870 RepID=UPI0034156AA5
MSRLSSLSCGKRVISYPAGQQLVHQLVQFGVVREEPARDARPVAPRCCWQGEHHRPSARRRRDPHTDRRPEPHTPSRPTPPPAVPNARTSPARPARGSAGGPATSTPRARRRSSPSTPATATARGALVTVPATGTILELTWERVTPGYRQSGYPWALDEILPPAQVPPQERAGTRRFELEWGAPRHTADGTVSFAESSAGAGDELRIGLWSWFVTGQVALPWTTAVRQDP